MPYIDTTWKIKELTLVLALFGTSRDTLYASFATKRIFI
jgi:hypothetical protein